MRSVTLAALFLLACVPSRSALFDPVARSVYQRTGVRPEWRSDWKRSEAAERQVRELLAQPLSAENAATLAVSNSPALHASYASLERAGAMLALGRTPPNPDVAAQLRFPSSGTETQLELSATESITRLLSLVPKFRVADAELRAVRREVVANTVTLASRARAAYFDLAGAEQRLSLRRTIADAASASVALARSLREAGNLTELAFAREAVFDEEARLSVREADAEAASAREHVNEVLGLCGEETAGQTQPLPDAPVELAALTDLEKESVAASLALDALRFRIEAAGQKIGVARLESFLPNLGIGVSAKREHEWGVGPQLSLSVPLFDWGQGPRAAAWADLRALQSEYAATAIAIRSVARAARERLRVAHERVFRMKTVVLPLREHLVDESLLQYNAMNLDAFQLLVVRREQIEAEERYIQALRDYHLAMNEVEELLAGALPNHERAEGEMTP